MEEYFCLFITIWKLNLAFFIIIINPLYAEFIYIAKKKKVLRNIGRKFRNSAVYKQAQAVVIFWNKTSSFCIKRNIP